MKTKRRRVREAGLLPSPALRTGREGFPSSSSSISKARVRTRQQSYHLLAARYCTEVDALMGKGAPVERATDICNTFSTDSSVFLVPRHRREVCPLSRRVMLPRQLAQPVSAPLQDGIRFFPPPYPHGYRLALRLSSLPCGRSDTGLPRSTRLTRTGEVLSIRR